MHLRLGLTAVVTIGVMTAGCAYDEMGRLKASRNGEPSVGQAPRGRFDRVPVAACGSGGLTEAGKRLIDRAPHLRLGADRAEVAFASRTARPATLHVTTPDGTPIASVDAAADRELPAPSPGFTAKVAGLAPRTTYCYELRAGDQVLVARTGFTTAPPLGSLEPIRFVAVGDIGKRTIDQRAVLEQLRQVEFDFLVVSGDPLFAGTSARALDEAFFDVYAPILGSFPLHVAGGVFGGGSNRPRWRSFDYGPAHIVILDTDRVGEEQARWLEEDLASTDQPWKVVIAHKPPFSSLSDEPDWTMQKYFIPLFEEHGVQLVIAGADHHYERSKVINGVQYVVSGAGGRGTRYADKSQFTAVVEQVSHFVYVTIEPSRLRMWAIDGTGQSFDGHAIAGRATVGAGERVADKQPN